MEFCIQIYVDFLNSRCKAKARAGNETFKVEIIDVKHNHPQDVPRQVRVRVPKRSRSKAHQKSKKFQKSMILQKSNAFVKTEKE